MSTPFDPSILTRRTIKDLTLKAWHLVKPVGDDDLNYTGLGDLPIGALTDDVADGTTNAVYLPVQVGGIIKVKCVGVIAAGSLAASDAAGLAIAVVGNAGSGNNGHAFGIALGACEAGEVGAFLWSPSWIEV